MPRQINPIIFPKHIFAEVKQCSFIQVNIRHSNSGWSQLIFKFSRMMVFPRWVSTIPSAFTLHAWADYCLHWTKALTWKDLGNCSLKAAIKSGPMFSHTQTSTYKWTGPWPKLWRTLSFHKYPFSSDSCAFLQQYCNSISSDTRTFSLYNNHSVKKGQWRAPGQGPGILRQMDLLTA